MTIRIKPHRAIALLVLVIVLLLSLIVNTTISYLVRKKTANNVFSVGLVELTVVEDEFPDNEQDRWIVPKGFLPKDPRIVNTGSVDVYVFAEVIVPYEQVLLILDEGEDMRKPDPQGRQYRELFNLFSEDEYAVSGAETNDFTAGFSVTEHGAFTYEPHWLFIRSREDTTAQTHSYLFGYNALLTTEAGHNTTTTIFDKIQLLNILEGDLPEDAVRTITIKAYGIQSDELKGNVTIADPTNITKHELQQLYLYYQNQEGEIG